MKAIEMRGMPNHLASEDVKNSPEWGLKAFQHAHSCITRDNYFQKRNEKFNRNTQFSRGEQSTDMYMDIMNINGRSPIISLDFSPSPIAYKHVEAITGKYMEGDEIFSVEAIDLGSLWKKSKEVADARFRMENVDFINQTQDQSGVQLEDPNAFIPKDETDLEIFKLVDNRTQEEILTEVGLDLVTNDNDYREIKRQFLREFAINGMGVIKCFYDYNGRITLKYIKNQRFICSYSEENTLDDAEWMGEVVDINVNNFRMKYQKDITEEEVHEIAMSCRGKHGNPTSFYDYNIKFQDRHNTPYDDYVLQGLELYIRTTSEVKGKPFKVLYQGFWVIGSNKVVGWKKVSAMIKPSKNKAEVFFPYVCYMNDNKAMMPISMLDLIVPTIRKLDLVLLKIQQIIAKERPNGWIIDVRGLKSLDIGTGGEIEPLELLEIADQTGTIFWKSQDDEGESTGAMPIQQTSSSIAGKISEMINAFNLYREQLRDFSGFNEYTDGSSVNGRSGAAVVRNQQASSNNALRYIYDAYESVAKRVARRIGIMFWDSICHNNGDYIKVIGEDNERYVKKNIANLLDFDFNAVINLITNDSQREYIESNIQKALDGKTIRLSDAQKVRSIRNPKLALLYLQNAEDKKLKEDTEKSLKLQEQNGKIQSESGMAVEQARQQTTQVKSEAELAVEQMKTASEYKLAQSKFMQDLIKSYVEGKEVPDFMMPLINDYLAELRGKPSTNDLEQADEMEEEESVRARQGDLEVKDGEILNVFEEGQTSYFRDERDVLYSEQGALIIPVEMAQDYSDEDVEGRTAIEQQLHDGVQA
jgi:hypothetical protein